MTYRKKKGRSSWAGEVLDVILGSPVGASLDDKLRQLLNLPQRGPSPEIVAEADGVAERMRRMQEEHHSDNASPYRVLGVDPGAEEAVVKAAWKAKSKLYHPDMGGSEAKMSEINRAYQEVCQQRGWQP